VIALDTNVLVRYLAQDDAQQSERATHLIEQEVSDTSPAFVSLIVLVETCWVMQRLYQASKRDICELVRDLLDSRQLLIDQRAIVNQALAAIEADPSIDFPDALIVASAHAAGCDRIATFDRRAQRAGMELLAT
jgi:predicted nucleic-acid-binding protein